MRGERSQNRLAGFIRQYVAITGLNLIDFNKTLEGIGKIHQLFEYALPNNTLEPMVTLLIDDNLAMACHTRYFTPARFCKSSIPYSFGPGIDPNEDLAKLAGTSYVHTEENVVQYLAEKSQEGESKCVPSNTCKKHLLIGMNDRFINIDPSRFQKGDIVEISISFFCVNTRSQTLKMLTSLKSIMLIDDGIRQVIFLIYHL